MSDDATLDEFADTIAEENEEGSRITGLGTFPSDWDVERITRCAEIRDSERIPLNSQEREQKKPGEIPYYGANGVLDYISEYIFDSDLILLAEDGGHFEEYQERPVAYRISGKSWVNNHAHILEAKDEIATDYLFYSLEHRNLVPYVSGSTRSKLTQTMLKKVEVPLPPLPEQRKIATVLYTVDRAIEKTEEIIEQTSRVKEGLVNEIVIKGIETDSFQSMRVGPHEFRVPEHWDIVLITEACENLDSERIPVSQSNREDMQGDIPYYGASGCVDYVDDYLFDEPLILLAEDGENLRSRTQRVAFKITGKSWVNNHAHALRPRDEFAIDYLVEYLERLDYRPYVSGSAQPKLNQTMLNKISVPKPPVEEQNRIASIIDEYKRKIQSEQDYRNRLQRLKRGLMQDLLSGTVRTTDTNIQVPDEIAQYG